MSESSNTSKVASDFAAWLNEQIVANGQSLTMVAEDIEMSPSSLSLLTRGKVVPTMETCFKLATYFGKYPQMVAGLAGYRLKLGRDLVFSDPILEDAVNTLRSIPVQERPRAVAILHAFRDSVPGMLRLSNNRGGGASADTADPDDGQGYFSCRNGQPFTVNLALATSR